MRKVLFSDLDGTFLDATTYSYKESLDALKLLQKANIPLVFCSAKTRAEQMEYRRKLEIPDPFIVENGGAIFISKSYFPFSFNFHKVVEEYLVIELGLPYTRITETLQKIRGETGLTFKGFADMNVKEISRDSGLSLQFARRAKQREYTETFKLEGEERTQKQILDKIKKAGLNYTHGGRYYEAMGNNDKGEAVTILARLFRQRFGEVITVGIGDSLNDLPMLATVDIPVLVQRPGEYWENLPLSNVYRVAGIGPSGWSKAIKEIVLP